MRRNHTGCVVGEQHHRAKLSDAQVAQMREAYAIGKAQSGNRFGYGTLAARFGCGASTARDICTYRTRP
ncbi:MAG: hypothetical protein IPN69_08650 [Acidobacteria bacterium]|nr:hypothetical protein [Acidobacteriota bacterium]